MKIISITPNSPILVDEKHAQNLAWRVSNEWASQEDVEMKRFHPELEIEGWMHSKDIEKIKEIEIKNVKFRIFRTDISIRHGMEISFQMLRALAREIRSIKKGEKLVVHLHEYHSWQSYLVLLLCSERARIICQHHGGRSPFKNLMKYKRLFLFLPAVILMQFFENLLFKKVDVFYALSDEEAGYLRRIGAKRIEFSTMGIQDKYFLKADKERLKRKLGLDKNKKHVLFLSRIKTTKGVKELLDAMKNINADLLLIGTGEDNEKYRKYAEESKIKNARFLGSIYGDEKLDYLSACDCLVLPSHTEGAPVVIMEALARNLPVVATNVGGIPKMIKNGREGMLINPKSSREISSAVNKVLAWKKADIRKYAEKYRWKKIIDSTLEDYEG